MTAAELPIGARPAAAAEQVEGRRIVAAARLRGLLVAMVVLTIRRRLGDDAPARPPGLTASADEGGDLAGVAWPISTSAPSTK